MASVRSAPTFTEVEEHITTYKYDASVVYDASYYDLANHSAQVGKAVGLVSDATVGLGASGGWPLGLLVNVEKDVCGVQDRGVVALPYNSGNANPPLVNRGVQLDGTGLVITPAGGVRLATERGTVLHLDATNQIAYVLF